MTARPPRSARLRLFPFWLGGAREWLGVLIGGLVLSMLFGGLWLLLDPRYPEKDVSGRVMGLGFVEVERRGSVSVASVDVDGSPVQVELPSRFGCRVGDQVRLRRLEVRWGYVYDVARMRWPCSRPPPLS